MPVCSFIKFFLNNNSVCFLSVLFIHSVNCPVASLLVAVGLAPVLPGASPCWCGPLHSTHCLILWWAPASIFIALPCFGSLSSVLLLVYQQSLASVGYVGICPLSLSISILLMTGLVRHVSLRFSFHYFTKVLSISGVIDTSLLCLDHFSQWKFLRFS